MGSEDKERRRRPRPKTKIDSGAAQGRLGSRPFFIQALEVVDAHLSQIAQQFDAVMKSADATGLAIAPAYGYLDDLVAEFVGDVEHLDIEAVAGKVLPGKDILRGRAIKPLKAALRIHEALDRDQPGKHVEDTPGKLAKRRLPDGDV